jgi:hypothetical protein
MYDSQSKQLETVNERRGKADDLNQKYTELNRE